MVEFTPYPSTWVVSVGTATAGTFTLTFRGQTTAPIAHYATAATVKTALVNLADDYGSLNWTVTGLAGGPWTVTTPGGRLQGSGSLTGGALTLTAEIPAGSANYASLSAWAAKTQEDWEDELRGREVTRWGVDGVLGGLFQGLNRDKPFVAALIEALIQEFFGEDGVFANVAEARAAARARFADKWNDLVDARIEAGGARLLARLRARAASNVISDSQAESDVFWTQPGTALSADEHRSGDHSVRMTRSADDRYLWFNTVDDGTVEPILSRPSESFYVEAFVRDVGVKSTYGDAELVVKGINSETGDETADIVIDDITFAAGTRNTWRKLSGYYTLPPTGYDTLSVGIKLPGNAATADDAVHVDDMLCREATDHQVSWNRFWDGLNGSTGSSGKRATDVEEAAGRVRGWALSSYRLARAKLRAGTNLVADSSIDVAEMWNQPYCQQVGTSVVEPYQGQYALQITSAGSTPVDVFFNTDGDGEVNPIEARLSEWYYVEAFVFCPSTAPDGTVTLLARLQNSRNNNVSDQVIATKTFTTSQKGSWQVMSGWVKIPAGYNRLSAGIRLAADATTEGSLWFVDQLLIREGTAAQRLFDLNKQRMRMGSQLLVDPNFDDIDYWTQTSVAQVGVTTVGSTTVTPRSGDYMLQVTSQGSTATEVFLNTAFDGTVEPIKARVGDWHYAEIYCWSPSANDNLTVQLVARFRNQRSGNTTDRPITTTSFTTANENLWVKISGYVQVPLGYNQISLGLIMPAGQSTSGSRIFLDGAFLTETTAAQRLFDISRKRLKRGTNLVDDSTFDSADWWTQDSVQQVGTITDGSTTIAPRSGNFSLQVTSRGATATDVYFNTSYDGTVEPIKARLGELFLIECYCLSLPSNDDLTVKLIARLENARTGVPEVVELATRSFSTLTENEWTRIWAYYKIPAGKNLISGGIRLPAGGSTAGNRILLDDALIRESTAAQRLADALFDGFTGSSGSVGRDPTEVFGAMGLVGDGTKALKLARQRAKVGPNFVNDPRAENVEYWNQPGVVQSSAYKRSGKYVLEMTSTKESSTTNGAATYAWWNTIDDGTIQPISTWLDDVLYMQCFYYAPSQTGTGSLQFVVKATNSDTGGSLETTVKTETVVEGGGWKKIFAVYTMPDGADSFSAGLKLTATGLTAQSPTFKVYTDSMLIREATASQRLTDKLHQALTGDSGTGKTDADVDAGLRKVFAKLFDGLKGNPEDTNTSKSGFELFAAAKEARELAQTGVTTAEDASTFAGEIAESGSNVIPNSDFESGLVSPQPLVASYSNDQAYSGTRSLKMTGTGTTKTFWLLSKGITPRTIPVSPDDVYLCEFYVFGSGITQTVTDGIQLVIEPISRSGGSLTDVYAGQTVSTALNNTWTKVSKLITLPPLNTVQPLQTVAKMKVGLRLSSSVTAGSVYFDQCSVREVTVAKAADDKAVTADGKAVTAQASAASAATAASNADSKAVAADAKAVTADGKAVTADGKAVTAQASAASANTAATNADTKAVTADAKAVTADNKAVAADTNASLADLQARLGSSANNLVISPDFEDPTVSRYTYVTTNPSTVEYSTAKALTGTRSLKLTQPTANGYALVKLANNRDGDTSSNGGGLANWSQCRPGEMYYIDCSIWLSHSSTVLFNFLGKNGGSWGTMSSLSWPGVTASSWQRIKDIFTVTSTTYSALLPIVGFVNATAGSNAYLDSVIIRLATPAETQITQTLTTRATGLGQNPMGTKLANPIMVKTITYRCGTADASGSSTFEIRKNGSAVSGTSATITAANQVAGSTVTGAWYFSAGDVLTVNCTAVGATPGTGLVAELAGALLV